MRYEFISRYRVPNKNGFSAQHILLNVGIACTIIAMVIEWILNNKFALVFAVPLAYLISLRGRMGGKADFRDVRTELVLLDDTVLLTYFGSILEKGRLLDQQYFIEKDQIKTITQERDRGKITLLFDGTVNIRELSGKVVRSRHLSGEAIPLSLPAELYGEVIAWLGPQ